MKILKGLKQFESDEAARALVESAENDFEERLNAIAKRVASDHSVRLVALSGPSCSGKTTTANKLISELEAGGRKVHVISIDDFFYDKEILEKRNKGNPDLKIDYDSINTIDFDALVECVREVFSYEKTLVPKFDFKQGGRVGYVEYDPDDDDLFIFEGIQAIYPEVSAVFKQYPSISVYICAASAVDLEGTIFEPNEVRFLRRIVRDYNFRGASPEFSMFLWESVRHNEDLSIFPYVNNCDMHIDSTLPFEINVLKPYLDDILSKVSPNSEFIEETRRIIEKIKDIKPIPREYLSKNSLYNEFI